MLDRLSLILTIIGALNWGAIGLFQFDLVAWIFGGQDALLSRIIYTVIALAGIYSLGKNTGVGCHFLLQLRRAQVVIKTQST